VNFEEAIERLEKITQDLEEGNLSLEESLKKFEEGMRLVNFCEQKLEEVEKRVKLLIKENGKLKLESWQPPQENKAEKEYRSLFKEYNQG
jgi:exodeoxyribonuclease VII small subunit